MFECEERGILATAGRAWSDEEIARAVGGDQLVALSCLQELVATGVAGRTHNELGAVYCRRMVRDEEQRKAGRLRVHKFRCNANVTRAVTPVSEDENEDEDQEFGKRRSERTAKGDSARVLPAELPHGFPESVDDAVRLAGHCGADATFITTLWNSAMAQSGIAGNGRPITSWQHYVAKHWPKEVEKRRMQKLAAPTPAKAAEQKAIEQKATEDLRKVRATLQKLDRMEDEARR